MSEFKKVYAKVAETIRADKKIITTISSDLDKVLQDAFMKAANSDESFCFKFNLPDKVVSSFFKLLQLSQEELDKAYTKDWGLPEKKEEARMYHEPYYQMIKLLIYHGIMTNNKKLETQAVQVLLFRLWNGRKGKYLQFCDKRIMNYIVAHMGSGRHLFTKYHNPFFLIRDYFTPTLISKYSPEIRVDYLKLQKMMSQGFSRIRQLFVYNPITNIETGKNEAQGGLLPLYMRAKKEGLYLTHPNGQNEDGFDSQITVNNREEIIQDTCNNIVMNSFPHYPEEFIKELNKELTVSTKTVDQLLKAVHNYKYFDKLQEAFTIILSQLKINEKQDICKPQFNQTIKTNIISSKNNKDSKRLQELMNELLSDIFKEVIQKDFNKYSNVQHIKLRNVIVRGLCYNLRKINCGN